MALGDRIVVMEHGRVAQIGTPREIYQRPATRFVAEFIGTMNRLAGSVRDGAFVTAAGNIPGRRPDAAEVLFRPEDVTLAETASAPRVTVARLLSSATNRASTCARARPPWSWRPAPAARSPPATRSA